ncbi:hypothetical protein PUNSTDRAFT_140171 [Punctularia strigosozonata HHB-11173 SS5]|uniref:uncharacterized protein n=1 Tax=Punctularia strigosozonata (strain HHB-11173) TaxID=741275 RepID=UPI000441749E|nr:uncharacterized protein PUNSTDRAFT_140171 [Punctularia strigosozonata HHB-11173 SS5]EIN13687.1 hypothetical protein PUNSTDRAFT_140171 [Punctularia strigosozonata HHB-11173 SS5]
MPAFDSFPSTPGSTVSGMFPMDAPYPEEFATPECSSWPASGLDPQFLSRFTNPWLAHQDLPDQGYYSPPSSIHPRTGTYAPDQYNAFGPGHRGQQSQSTYEEQMYAVTPELGADHMHDLAFGTPLPSSWDMSLHLGPFDSEGRRAYSKPIDAHCSPPPGSPTASAHRRSMDVAGMTDPGASGVFPTPVQLLSDSTPPSAGGARWTGARRTSTSQFAPEPAPDGAQSSSSESEELRSPARAGKAPQRQKQSLSELLGFPATDPELISAHEKKRNYLTSLEEYIKYLHNQMALAGEQPPPLVRMDGYKGLSSRSVRTMLIHMQDQNRTLHRRVLEQEQTFLDLHRELALKEDQQPFA